jgi:membrane protease subunit HflK
MYLKSLETVLSNSSKILVDTDGNNNMLYLPLDRLVQGGGTDSSGKSAKSGGNQADVKSLTDQVIKELRSRQQGTNQRRSR